MKANLELRIEELVLRGLPHGQRYAIAAAVEAELQRLLEQGGLPPSLVDGGRLADVKVNDLNLAAGTKPEAAGAQIAASVYRNLMGSGASIGLPGRSKA